MIEWQRTKSGRRKVSDNDVRMIRKMAAAGMTYGDIQKDNFPGISRETIARIARRETFTAVSDYDFATVPPLNPDIEESLANFEKLKAMTRAAKVRQDTTDPEKVLKELTAADLTAAMARGEDPKKLLEGDTPAPSPDAPDPGYEDGKP